MQTKLDFVSCTDSGLFQSANNLSTKVNILHYTFIHWAYDDSSFFIWTYILLIVCFSILFTSIMVFRKSLKDKWKEGTLV